MAGKGLIEKVTFKHQPEGSGGEVRETSGRRAFKAAVEGGRTASERALMHGNSWYIRGIRT